MSKMRLGLFENQRVETAKDGQTDDWRLSEAETHAQSATLGRWFGEDTSPKKRRNCERSGCMKN